MPNDRGIDFMCHKHSIKRFHDYESPGKVYEAENEESEWKETVDAKAPHARRSRSISLFIVVELEISD